MNMNASMHKHRPARVELKQLSWCRFFGPLALLLFGLAGCSASAAPGKWNKPGKVAVYECEQGVEFVVDSQPETAWLFLPGQTLALPRVRSGSGARYSNEKVSFWSKGDEALLDLQSQRTYHCNENRARSIWEEAKLRGVGFRATGNEPAWSLEIGPETILLTTDYGQQQTTYPLPTASSDPQKRQTTYRAGDLTILLEGSACHDSMSGEPFETTVTVKVGARSLQGCGRALH